VLAVEKITVSITDNKNDDSKNTQPSLTVSINFCYVLLQTGASSQKITTFHILFNTEKSIMLSSDVHLSNSIDLYRHAAFPPTTITTMIGLRYQVTLQDDKHQRFYHFDL